MAILWDYVNTLNPDVNSGALLWTTEMTKIPPPLPTPNIYAPDANIHRYQSLKIMGCVYEGK